MKYFIVEMNVTLGQHAEILHKLEVDDYDVCIFFAPTEWEYWFDADPSRIWPKLLEVIKRRNKHVDVITGAHVVLKDEPLDTNVSTHHWDTHWMYITYDRHWNFKKVPPPNLYNYHYVYMNHKSHTWRCHLIDLVSKHKLLPYGAVSWHNYPTEYEWKYFQPKEMTLTDPYAESKDHFILPEEYNQSFAQLISESNLSATFMTEKTCIPLLLAKPFLVSSTPDYHKFLEKIGFELYTEIFDYSFDSEPDHEKRFEGLLENFDRLCKLPLSSLPDLYKKIEDKLNRNKQHALNIGKNQIGKPAILKNIPDSLWQSPEWVYNKYISYQS